MVRLFSSNKHNAFVLALLLCAVNFAATLQEGGDTIDPSEQDEWEEEEPKVPEYTVPEGMQTLKFSPANLTDEDQHSQHMPMDLKCDGCRIIAYLMTQELNRIQRRYKKSHRLKESELIDLLERVCKDKDEKFNGYGIKEINKVRRLSGEGLETKDVPGVLQGGGKWPYRLVQMCLEYVGELGEEEIYDHYLADKSVEDLLCRSKQLGNICQPKKMKKKASKKAQSKDEL